MLKVTGCVLVSLSVLGFTFVSLYKKRVACMRWLYLSKVCEALAENIRYKRAELFEVLSVISETDYGCGLGFFGDLCGLEHNYTRENIEKVTRQYIDDHEAFGVTVNFLSGLGRSDAEGQLKHCEAYRAMFFKEYEKASGKYSTDRRVYLSVGGYIAAAAFIMLI